MEKEIILASNNVKKLEEIAKKLEQGASLDESLKLYEEGCKRSC